MDLEQEAKLLMNYLIDRKFDNLRAVSLFMSLSYDILIQSNMNKDNKLTLGDCKNKAKTAMLEVINNFDDE
jgi:hypothetical protein